MKILNVFRHQSYCDLWKLIELSGLPVVEQTPELWAGDEPLLVTVNNADVQNWARQPRRCKLTLFQLERRCGSWEEFLPAFYDSILLADRRQAEEAKAHHRDVRYCPVGGHPDFGGVPDAEKKYDLAAMAYLAGQRGRLVQELSQKYRMAPNAFPPERDAILKATRAGLAFHQWTPMVADFYIEPLRMCMMASYRLPIITEYCYDTYPFNCYGVDDIEKALVDDRGYAVENFKTMTDTFNFKRILEEAI